MLTLRENGVSAFILLYYVVRSVLNYVLISDVMYTHLEKVSCSFLLVVCNSLVLGEGLAPLFSDEIIAVLS